MIWSDETQTERCDLHPKHLPVVKNRHPKHDAGPPGTGKLVGVDGKMDEAKI